MLSRGLTRYLCFAKVSLLQCDDQKREEQEWTQRSQLKVYSSKPDDSSLDQVAARWEKSGQKETCVGSHIRELVTG